MTTYLTIITTVLVLTQIIRVTQNYFNLMDQRKAIDEELAHIGKYNVDDALDIQQKVFRMLYEKLKEEAAEE